MIEAAISMKAILLSGELVDLHRFAEIDAELVKEFQNVPWKCSGAEGFPIAAIGAVTTCA